MNWLSTTNLEGCVPLSAIPAVDYAEFFEAVDDVLARTDCHAVEYFAVPRTSGALSFYILIANDASGKILLASHIHNPDSDKPLGSLAAVHPQLHPFEREIAELHGIAFEGAPWPKPLRNPVDYPFYKIAGESLHEVNVGPIHAGIIEPGAFRFICNGERVLHLEIALGYQHRRIEELMIASQEGLRRVCLAESIAGDSTVAHATAHALVMERLGGFAQSDPLDVQRGIALELERMAMHLADISALCTDIGYQLGQVACEALRTIVINITQRICGNRFGRSWIRPAGSYCAIDVELAREVLRGVAEVVRRFDEILEDLKSSPSVLSRFEECGVLGLRQAQQIGMVGLAARASGLPRDVRRSHPWGVYNELGHKSITRQQGDVMARLMVRARELAQSAKYVQDFVELSASEPWTLPVPDYRSKFTERALAFALVEGWRGEICHVALTDARGRATTYKIKDPSMHNWLGLALAVRDEGISDFPICNKSFDLSYAGHDL